MNKMTLTVSPEDRVEVDGDDLPKTLRKAAVARSEAEEAAERVVIAGFDISFARLAVFLVKLVLAAVPALVVLTALLVLVGEVLTLVFPSLVKLKILIYVPQ